MVLCGALVHASPSTQQIEADGRGETISVTATAEMLVDPHTAWKVITDYDHLAEFIPSMRSSRVVRRDADRVLIEQSGEFSFLSSPTTTISRSSFLPCAARAWC